ncbi:MAG: hypothetical protein J0H68_04430 [Sphingobacteriia bacterium]|nr:hypothetical protein [Sphingobacteriia bacterium]
MLERQSRDDVAEKNNEPRSVSPKPARFVRTKDSFHFKAKVSFTNGAMKLQVITYPEKERDVTLASNTSPTKSRINKKDKGSNEITFNQSTKIIKDYECINKDLVSLLFFIQQLEKNVITAFMDAVKDSLDQRIIRNTFDKENSIRSQTAITLVDYVLDLHKGEAISDEILYAVFEKLIKLEKFKEEDIIKIASSDNYINHLIGAIKCGYKILNINLLSGLVKNVDVNLRLCKFFSNEDHVRLINEKNNVNTVFSNGKTSLYYLILAYVKTTNDAKKHYLKNTIENFIKLGACPFVKVSADSNETLYDYMINDDELKRVLLNNFEDVNKSVENFRDNQEIQASYNSRKDNFKSLYATNLTSQFIGNRGQQDIRIKVTQLKISACK